jgi:HJR/Mrr/RecB family endonuclease
MAHIEIKSANIDNISPGRLNVKYSASGERILRYYIDVTHNKLHLHKELSAPELSILKTKMDILMSTWDKKWSEQQVINKLSKGSELAKQLSLDAVSNIEGLSNILAHTLKVNDAVNWDSLKDYSKYPTPPDFEIPEPVPQWLETPVFQRPNITFLDKIFGKKKKKYESARSFYASEVEMWEAGNDEIQRIYEQDYAEWLASKNQHDEFHRSEMEKFYLNQKEYNIKINNLRESWISGNTDSIIEHAALVLEASNYHDFFEKSFEIDFNSQDGLLLLEYDLPSPDNMPIVKSVRFIKDTGELKETYISERDKKSNYDSVCYQICLRTIHELFEADIHCHLNKILFNGFSEFIDSSTGRDVRASIMSILVDRSEFISIDLSRVDPKACFKNLKGVSAASLASLSPIAPIMELNKEDRRFIEARATVDNLDDYTNLAAMDWQDFEHFIREIFEREFLERGGEVHVTQSSGDGGVDAIAFDPDPISGGKIVIQAKRYTKTVGVSAVRDLYGTVLNEGATKGILVTTADFGPDAYKFASDKPLALMTGSHLLHLLERHGIKAKIDLRAAREALALKR